MTRTTNTTTVTVIDKPYSDIFVVNSARVSFSKESDFDENGNLKIGDQRLLNYLASHGHWTPFSHVRETFAFDVDTMEMDWFIQTTTQEMLASIVLAQGSIEDKPYWLIRHSLYGWINLLKADEEEFIFQPIVRKFIIKKLSELYPGSMTAFGMHTFEEYNIDELGLLAQYIPDINAKNNDVYVVNMYTESRRDYFIDVTVREEVPIYVARQRFKHMIGFCIAGDTEISFERTNTVKNGISLYKIKDLYTKWMKETPHSRSGDLYGHRKVLMKKPLRVLDDTTGKFVHAKLTNIIYSGKKELYKITLEDGYNVTMTKDHKVFTRDNNWLSLEDAIGLGITQSKTAYMTKECYLATNGVEINTDSPLYDNYEWIVAAKASGMKIQKMADESGTDYKTMKKYLKKYGIKFNPIDNLSGKGDIPWNKGKTGYYISPPVMPDTWLENVKIARSGNKSNFWKGGVSSERSLIAAWVQQNRKKIYERDGYTCQNCSGVGKTLNAHHIVPVYANLSLAKDINNMITLCKPCHQYIHSNNLEQEFALHRNIECNFPIEVEKPKGTGNTLYARYKKVISVEYVGIDDTYDLTVDHPSHNFVGNGVVLHNCYNESSRRYVDFEPQYFMPDVLRGRADNKKQGSTDTECKDHEKSLILYNAIIERANDAYNTFVDREWVYDMCPEQARGILPQAMMTDYYATGNLKAWQRLITQRLDAHAQKEIRDYAILLQDALTNFL